MIYTVILKPTKACNADCTYCSSPPDKEKIWKFADFKLYFDKISALLAKEAVLIWHGGEPMLAGPDFYTECFEYAQSICPDVTFSIQSNILLYSTDKWFDVFKNVFKGSVSTSFDPDEENRVISGSSSDYTSQFNQALDTLMVDGFQPMIIGTYTQSTAHLAMTMYQRNLALPAAEQFQMRMNYRYPAGRAALDGEVLTPERYGSMLLELYNKWIVDNPDFAITPLNQMLKKVIGEEATRCPWLNSCGGRFISIEPNGDVYNCADFADLNDETYLFGNLKKDSIETLLASPASAMMRRRRVNYPTDCGSCEHFNECEGGCMRDSVLYGHGLGGKFHYCESWKMIFKRIKQSVLSGELDIILRERFDLDPNEVKSRVETHNNQGAKPTKTPLPKKFIPIYAAGNPQP
jgi:radical SAM protein with 4Fe4S-binding SPASM domain